MNTVYLYEGAPHRFCDCDTRTEKCPRGGTRSLQTAGFSKCLIPAPDVVLAQAPQSETAAKNRLTYVIEKGSPAQYFSGFDYGQGKWTAEYAKALHFGTREEAQRLWDTDVPIFTIYNDGCRIEEHMECGGPEALPSATPRSLSEFVHADESMREAIGSEVVKGAIARQNAAPQEPQGSVGGPSSEVKSPSPAVAASSSDKFEVFSFAAPNTEVIRVTPEGLVMLNDGGELKDTGVRMTTPRAGGDLEYAFEVMRAMGAALVAQRTPSATRDSVIEECAKIADIAAIGASCRPDREIPEGMCRLIAGEIRALKQRRYVGQRSTEGKA